MSKFIFETADQGYRETFTIWAHTVREAKRLGRMHADRFYPGAELELINWY